MSPRLSAIWVAIVALCAMTNLSCMNPMPPEQAAIGEGAPTLFIGNSYTYVNDLPGLVQALADSAGVKLAVEMVAGPDLALIDHWNEGTSRREIAKGGWKTVILQQGPSAAQVNRDSLRLWSKL